nr:hypothetical protein [Fusobacterium gastrosuis]
MNIIKNFEEIEIGDNYIKIENVETLIKIRTGFIKIQFLKTGVTFFREAPEETGFLTANNLKKELEKIENIDQFTDYCFSSFEEIRNEKIKFNPFFKENKGKIEVSKKITQKTLEKILKHNKTIVKIVERCTDDYTYDTMTEYSKGKIISNIEILEDLTEEKAKICTIEENGKINFFLNGWGTLYELINPAIILKA